MLPLLIICLVQALLVQSRAWTHRPRRRSLIWTPCTPHPRSPPPEFGLEHQHSGALLQSLLPELYAWADSLQAVQFPETATGPCDTASGASSGDAALPAHQSGQDVTGGVVIDSQSNILSAASSRRAPIKAPNHIVHLCN